MSINSNLVVGDFRLIITLGESLELEKFLSQLKKWISWIHLQLEILLVESSWLHIFWVSVIFQVDLGKVHIFWEGHKSLQNIQLTFVLFSASQK